MPDEIIKFSKKSGSSIVQAMKENPEKVGGILVKLATQQYDRDFTSAVIDRVKELVKHRQALQLALEKTQKEIELFDNRIEAIENGEFKLHGDGSITYNQAILNFR